MTCDVFRGNGRIQREYTIWCSKCHWWEHLEEWTVHGCERQARSRGWRKRKGLWVCPDCIAQEKPHTVKWYVALPLLLG